MRVLAYIHTFNDADVIQQSIAALLRQTRAVDEILVVDNASTDGTLDQPGLQHATVVRHPENTGTSGAVATGFRYALDRGYDWMWILDPDAVPAQVALEKMLDLYDGWPRVQQDRTGFLTCLHPERWHDAAHRNFTWRGLVPAKPTPGKSYYRCDNAQWSGCLYRMAAVRKIGFPNVDYFIDWSESEYDYRMVRAGFKGFVCRDAPIKSNIRGYAALRPPETERANATAAVLEYPPFRCYYTARNRLYFTLYEYEKTQPVLLLRMVVTLGLMMIKVLLLQPGRKGVADACIHPRHLERADRQYCNPLLTGCRRQFCRAITGRSSLLWRSPARRMSRRSARRNSAGFPASRQNCAADQRSRHTETAIQSRNRCRIALGARFAHPARTLHGASIAANPSGHGSHQGGQATGWYGSLPTNRLGSGRLRRFGPSPADHATSATRPSRDRRRALQEDGAIIAAGFLADGAGEPTFAYAGWADEGEIVLRIDPFALGELLEQRAIETSGGAVKVGLSRDKQKVVVDKTCVRTLL